MRSEVAISEIIQIEDLGRQRHLEIGLDRERAIEACRGGFAVALKFEALTEQRQDICTIRQERERTLEGRFCFGQFLEQEQYVSTAVRDLRELRVERQGPVGTRERLAEPFHDAQRFAS